MAYGAKHRLINLRATSAGTAAVIAHPMHSNAAHVLKQLGGDSSDFAARQLTAKIASEADLVIAMTRDHRDAVLRLAPRQLRRTFTLIEASRLISDFDVHSAADLADQRPNLPAFEVQDIVDPVGQSLDVFQKVGFYIADLLPPILKLCD